jgi:hypothetical protein
VLHGIMLTQRLGDGSGAEVFVLFVLTTLDILGGGAIWAYMDDYGPVCSFSRGGVYLGLSLRFCVYLAIVSYPCG